MAWALTDFETARSRRVDLLTGGVVDLGDPQVAAAVQTSDVKAKGYWDTLNTSVSRTVLWSDLAPFSDPGMASTSLDRLRTMAIAWAAPSSAYYQNTSLLADMLGALSFWGNTYSASSTESGNWWFWEIGMPNLLADLGILLFGQTSAAQTTSMDSFIGHFVADPNVRTNSPTLKETGANRSDKAHIAIRHGLFVNNAVRITAGRDALSDVAGGGVNSLFRYVTAGDGFYADGSFVQHTKLAYIGSYGLVTLDGVADILPLLAGTAWAVTDPKVRIFYDAVLSNFAWSTFDGRPLDPFRGRSVSRQESSDHALSQTQVGAVAQLVTASPEYAAAFQSLVKGWITRDPAPTTTSKASLSRMRQIKAIAADPAIPAAAPLVLHVQTPDQDRVVHQQGSWAAAISLSSNRMGRYEWGNNENNLGWYQGDGMLQFHLASDRFGYDGDYWATSDPYHLPGVTNGLQVRASGAGGVGTGIPGATQAWAGGVGWLGRVGAVGMDHKAYDGNLVARKSWFCLPDAVVSLGSGVASSQGQQVHTTLESRKLAATTQVLTVDGVAAPTTNGSTTLNNPGWAQLSQVGGYLFLGPQTVQSVRQTRTGTWQAVNSGGPTGIVSNDYQTLYVDHGVNPTGGSYAYATLPGASVADTQSRAAAPGFAVVANTTSVQAISVSAQALLLANFFAAGTAGGVTVNQPAAVVVGEDANLLGGTDIVVAISDPPRLGLPINVVVNRSGGTVLEYAEKTTFTAATGQLNFTVPTSGTRGHGQTFRFGPTGTTVKNNATGTGLNQWNFSSGWTVGSLDSYSTTSGSTASLKFQGSRVYLQAAKGPSQGIITVSLDGGTPQTVDLFALVRNGVTVISAFGGLSPATTHTLTVTCTGNRNPRATLNAAAVSGAVVVP